MSIIEPRVAGGLGVLRVAGDRHVCVAAEALRLEVTHALRAIGERHRGDPFHPCADLRGGCRLAGLRQSGGHLTCALEPIRGPSCEATHQHRVVGGAEIGAHAAGRRRRSAQDLRHDLALAGSFAVRALRCQRLPQHDRRCEDVGLPSHGHALELLRRHVGELALEAAALACLMKADVRLGDAEVQHP